jgi:transposase
LIPSRRREGQQTRCLLADRAHDSDEIRQALRCQNAQAVIPGRQNRVAAIDCDTELYKARSEIECTFSLLKQARRFVSTLRENATQLRRHHRDQLRNALAPIAGRRWTAYDSQQLLSCVDEGTRMRPQANIQRCRQLRRAATMPERILGPRCAPAAPTPSFAASIRSVHTSLTSAACAIGWSSRWRAPRISPRPRSPTIPAQMRGLRARGFLVLRFSAVEVCTRLEAVIARIRQALRQPLPQAGGEAENPTRL